MTNAALAERLKALSPEKQKLFLRRLQESQSKSPEQRPARPTTIPLAPSQLRLWFLDKIDDQSAAYNVFMAVKIVGAINTPDLLQSINQMVQRHENLRTTFQEGDAEPYQVIHQHQAPDFEVLEPNSEQALADLIDQTLLHQFDLSEGPLYKIRLLRSNENECILVFVMHHIISDGWSLGLFFNELKFNYQSIQKRNLQSISSHSLPPLTIQYADYAISQTRKVETGQFNNQLDYWLDKLKGAPALLDFPFDHPRQLSQHGADKSDARNGGTSRFIINSTLLQKIQGLATQSQSSLFMVGFAAYSALLNLYSGQNDIVIGTPIANRQQKELESLIGFFVNSLALRVQFHPEMTFTELLQQIKSTSLDAYENQDIPFNKVVEGLNLSRNLDYNPVFQTMFIVQNAPTNNQDVAGLKVSPYPLPQHKPMFDLMFSLTEANGEIQAIISYNNTLFDHASVLRLQEHYINLLECCVETPDTSIYKMDLRAKKQYSIKQNHPAAKPSSSLLTMFAQAAQQRPTAIALSDPEAGSPDITYQQLNQRSDLLAHWLLEQGIKQNDAVALWMPRCAELFTWKLACLKAGAAYVPIVLNSPQERIKEVIGNSQAKLLIHANDEPSTGLSVATESRVEWPTFDTWVEQNAPACQSFSDREVIDQLNLRPTIRGPLPDVSEKTHAYILYTSGSTGKPKGVTMPHLALGNLIQWHLDHQRLSQACRTLQFASAGFDVCFQEFASTLCCGGTLVICPEAERIDGKALLRFIDQQSIERLFLPYVALQNLAESAANEKHAPVPTLVDVVTAGEQLKITQAIRHFFTDHPNCRLHNHYGPTETHVVTALQLADKVESWPNVPDIGYSINHTTLYILNAQMMLQAEGMPGELYVSGNCLANGYLQKPELTSERFINLTLDDGSQERVYRTGDLVRQLEDGNLAYLGRLDQQVKIRGFRVEPGEVEAVINSYQGIKVCAVVPHTTDESNSLVCYLTGDIDLDALHAWLNQQIPDYLIPSVWVMLDVMPLTSSGKVDRNALPAPEPTITTALAKDNAEHIAPSNPLESSLLEIWTTVLSQPSSGITDNFFDLGGHSLLATKLLNRIRSTLGVDISVKRLFENPTVKQLAKSIKTDYDNALEDAKTAHVNDKKVNDNKVNAAQITKAPEGTVYPLSYAQERLWFIHQMEDRNASYNMPIALELCGPLCIDSFSESIKHVITRHEVLRTNFKTVDDSPRQVINHQPDFHWASRDISTLSSLEQASLFDQTFSREASHRFDLASEPLLRIHLLKLSEQKHSLIMVLHHIVFDGWSTPIFLSELSQAYDQLKQSDSSQNNLGQNKTSPSPLQIQYADYAYWQRQYLTDERIESHIQYWRSELAGANLHLNLAHGTSSTPHRVSKGHKTAGVCLLQTETISTTLSAELTQFAKQKNVTPYVIFLSAFASLLQRLSGQSDLIIGTTIANRTRQELEPMVGFFVNTLPIRIAITPSMTYRELLSSTYTKVVSAQHHQELPFDVLVKSLKPERRSGVHPIYQVVFDYQHNDSENFTLDELSFSIKPSKRGSAKFPLIMAISNDQSQYHVVLEYDSNIFTSEHVAELHHNYQIILKDVFTSPDSLLFNVSNCSDNQVSTDGTDDAAEQFNF